MPARKPSSCSGGAINTTFASGRRIAEPSSFVTPSPFSFHITISLEIEADVETFDADAFVMKFVAFLNTAFAMKSHSIRAMT